MRTIEPMMPKPLGSQPQPTMSNAAALFCAAVVLVLVTAGTLGQRDAPQPATAKCVTDMLVIPASDNAPQQVFSCVQ